VERGVAVTSMGRLPTADPIYFHAAAAAGALAAARIPHRAGRIAPENR
jgi:hypothetical protein